MTPRQARALLELALDEVTWIWSRRISFLLDELVIREDEQGA